MKGRKNMAGKALDPHLWNLENLFKCMYDVPVYQRPYSWDKEQVEVLLNDIIEAYQSDSGLATLFWTKLLRTRNYFNYSSYPADFKVFNPLYSTGVR